MEEQSVPPIIHQMFLMKAGMFCSERLSVDIVYVNQMINLLLPTFNKEEIKKEYEKQFGEDSWEKLTKYRRKLVKRIAESKTYYDSIEDKSLLKRVERSKSPYEQAKKIFKNFFFKSALKIYLMEEKIYEFLVFLIMNSNIQRFQIKNEYFRNLEQKSNKSIKIDKTQPQRSA